MKITTIIFFLLSFQLFAQSKKASVDTTKKITFTEIIKVDSANRFELYKKAEKWVEQNKFEVVEVDPIEGKILAKDQVIVYTDRSVLAKPNGDFFYDIILEVKDGKYRYSFTNFVYRFYKQDRNLEYKPVKGSKPIEDTKAQGWKKQWSKNKMQVTAEVNNHIKTLKEAMSFVAPKPVAKPKPKEEW